MAKFPSLFCSRVVVYHKRQFIFTPPVVCIVMELSVPRHSVSDSIEVELPDEVVADLVDRAEHNGIEPEVDERELQDLVLDYVAIEVNAVTEAGEPVADVIDC